jgi:hypothetical protein
MLTKWVVGWGPALFFVAGNPVELCADPFKVAQVFSRCNFLDENEARSITRRICHAASSPPTFGFPRQARDNLPRIAD